jgi:hypothetical protein
MIIFKRNIFFLCIYVFTLTTAIASNISPNLLQFSSRYYDTQKECQCLETELRDGQDCVQYKCKDLEGHSVSKNYDGSACDSGILSISKGKKFKLGPINTVPKNIEIRFANSIPFAIIYRIEVGSREHCIDPTAKTVKQLKGQGLENFQKINEIVSANEKNSNEKIRELVDQSFRDLSK